MPRSPPSFANVVCVVLLCLQVSLLTPPSLVHCAPAAEPAAAAATFAPAQSQRQTKLPDNNSFNAVLRYDMPVEPPLEFPTDRVAAAAAAATGRVAPLLFPTDRATVDVRQAEGVPPPPSEFPADRPNVLRMDAAGAGLAGNLVLLPPLEFPTDRKEYKIRQPAAGDIAVTLDNLRRRKVAMSPQIVLQSNPKDDAVRLEDTADIVQNPQQLEEQYGFRTNHLIAQRQLTSDDSALLVDRPHSAQAAVSAGNIIMTLMLTAAVMGVCVLLGMLVWRKYVHQKYNQRVRLIDQDQEETFNGFQQP